MKILAGAVRAGRRRGHAWTARPSGSPPRATPARVGIGIVYQELSLFPERSILANLFLDHQPTRFGLVDAAAMRRAGRARCSRGSASTSTRTRRSVGWRSASVSSSSSAALLIERPGVLILDEPNSALNERETQRLFTILRELSADGDDDHLRVAPTRGGLRHRRPHHGHAQRARSCTTQDRAATTMQPRSSRPWSGRHRRPCSRSGRPPPGARLVPPRRPGPGADRGACLDRRRRPDRRRRTARRVVRGASRRDRRPGRPRGLGRGDAARRPLRDAPSGRRHDPLPDGRAAPASPTAAARRRISLVPADRRHQGLMLDRSVAMNIAQVAVGALPSRRPWLDRRAMGRAARRQIEGCASRRMARTRSSAGCPAATSRRSSSASGSRSHRTSSCSTTRRAASTSGAKHEIYRLIRELADSGRIVLFRSTELPEIVGLADRILVFYRGRLEVEIAGGEIDDHGLLQAINTGRRPAVANPLGTASAGPAPSVTSRQRRSPHDPPCLHDAPEARRARGVQGPSRPDLAGPRRRDRAPGHRPDHDLRDRSGALPLLGDRATKEPGTGCGTPRSTTAGARS